MNNLQQHNTAIQRRTSAQQSQREYLNQSSDLIAAFLVRYRKKPNTYSAYYNALVHFFGTEKVDVSAAIGVSDEMVNDYFNKLTNHRGEPSSQNTKAQKMSAIRGFYTWLRKKKLISADENPFDGDVQQIKVNKGEASVVFLSKDQVRAMLDCCEHTRDELIVKMLVYLGLRRSELAAVCCEHFTMQGAYNVLMLPYTKGGEGQSVKVPAHLIQAIEQHKAEYGIASGPLFLSFSNFNRDKPISPDAVYRLIKRLVMKAGLQSEIGAHTLRHTSAMLMLDGGADVLKVKTVLRHSSLQTTTVYSHQRDKLADSGVDYIRI